MTLAAPHALVIDDSPLVQRLVREQLEDAGYRVDAALDGVMGLERAGAAQHDVIVCDLEMPRMGGLEAIRRLKELLPSVPIVVLTEVDAAEPAVEALRLGAAAWVRKGDDLLKALARVLEQHRAEESRRHEDAMHRQVVSSTLDYLFDASREAMMVHRHGCILRVNRAFLACFRLQSEDELLGQSLVALTPQEHHEEVEGSIRAATSGRSTAPITFVATLFDGTPLELEAFTLPIVFQGERASLVIVRDLTERRRQDAARAMTDRMTSIGIIAAGAAHEINNPLAFMLASHHFLAEELGRLPVSDEVHEAMRDLGLGLQRVRAIAADLKGMSRESARGPVDVRRELELAMRMASPNVKTRATVISELADVPAITGEGNRLTQVFLNLMINAAQAMPEGRSRNEIRVKLHAADQDVVIEISDNGSGISPEVMRRLFQPFFTTKPAGVGTGLGLHISKQIVEAHGGKLSVESRAGAGTTFTIALPISRP